MTHMHIAGSIHADAMQTGPQWLSVPTDVNALDRALWSESVQRQNGEISVAGLGVTTIAEQVGTPAYVIDEVDFRRRAATFRDSFQGWEIFYAGKALLTKTIARWINEEGLSLDVCTGGELAIALAGGMPPERIGMHGNNKSVAELEAALAAGVGRIIVDSFDEIGRIEQACRSHGWRARVLIRVTTGIEAHTHEYIATAHEDQKFGFSILGGHALVALVRCHNSTEIDLLGIHSHIGSQIFNTAGFEVAMRRVMKLAHQFRSATGTELDELDLGGGFGIAYTVADHPSTIEDLARSFNEIVEHECRAYSLERPKLSIEPGRAICGPAGLALYTVGTVKVVDLDRGQSRVYVSVDGGMSDNIRPALYAAEYSAVVANRSSDADPVLCRVVGKHCEGGDILVRDVFLPGDIQPGDLLAVPASGAYSRSMASNYNALTRPPLVAVREGELTTLLRRETLADLMALDVGE